MIPAPLPPDENARLAALVEAAVLDTLPEREFDDITRLAATICGTPIALVSLVDRDRQWFKSRFGLDALETPREQAFCAHAILTPDRPFVVENAQTDPRFAGNPLVTGKPDIRFYAGMPVFAESGAALGTLCVIDQKARSLTPEQREALESLARQVSHLLAARVRNRELARLNDQLAASQQLLRHAVEQHEEFLDSVSDLVETILPDGRLLSVNQAWLEKLGYTHEDAASMNGMRICAPESEDAVRDAIHRLFSGEVVPPLRLNLLTKSGERLVADGTAHAFFEGGKPTHARIMLRDVTVEVRARDALSRSVAELEATLDATGDGILCLDTEGRVARVNRGLCSMWKFDDGTAQGGLEAILAAIAAQLETPDHLLSAMFTRHGVDPLLELKDGRCFEVLSRAQRAGEEVLGQVIVFRDVTERRHMDRMKNEFVSTVSHELRTPLTSMRGALGLLESGLLGTLEPQAQEFTVIARTNTDRLIRLVNDILDLEKLGDGKLSLRKSRVDAATLLAKAQADLRGLANTAGVRVEVVTPQGAAPMLGDEDRLLQVVENLGANAVKFSPAGGVVQLRADAAAGHIRVEVRDQGPGIPQAQLHKLFRRFQQLDSSDVRRHGGSGLGLAISKAIVEEHGGRIGVSTREGEGSTFWFELPEAV